MKKTVRKILLFVLDVALIAASVYVSYLLRFEFDVEPRFTRTFGYIIPLYVFSTIPWLFYFKIYRRIWRYASVGDMLSVLKGSVAGAITVFILHNALQYLFDHHVVVPRSIHLMSMITIFFSIGGSRLGWRLLKDNYTPLKSHHKRALVIGAGETGLAVVRELKHSDTEYYPVAFIDDSPDKKNYEVMGVPVVGSRDEIMNAVARFDIDIIIIAIPSASRKTISELIHICKKTNCQIKIIPRMNDLISGKVSISTIRDVNLEDLLGREPVKIDLDEIASYLTDRTVLITGAGGSIGSEISRQVSTIAPKQLIILDHSENNIYDIEIELKSINPNLPLVPIIADIKNKDRLIEIFNTYRPDVVFHAAAHKHVPLMENNPVEAVHNNVFGTLNLAECSHQFGVSKFVLISTDKAVNPTSVMGTTKRIAEMIIQSFNGRSETSFAAVRFGNVLGSRGSVVPLFKSQIEKGGPVTVTHPEMYRYFMTIPEAVQLVIQAGALARGGEIFILDMGKPVKIADLAHDLIRLSGLQPGKDIKIIYTGLRPGEKLFEELFTKEEGTVATKHDRIFVGQPEVISDNVLYPQLDKLRQVKTREETISILKQIVPSYERPGEIIDKEEEQKAREAFRASLEIVAALENK